MKCPICQQSDANKDAHKACLVSAFESGQFKSKKEWDVAWTKVVRKIRLSELTRTIESLQSNK